MHNDGDGLLLEHALDQRAHAGDADVATTVNDLTLFGERDQDAGLFQLRSRRRLGLVDLDAGLFNERRRDDEEDQKDEHAVHQR